MNPKEIILTEDIIVDIGDSTFTVPKNTFGVLASQYNVVKEHSDGSSDVEFTHIFKFKNKRDGQELKIRKWLSPTSFIKINVVLSKSVVATLTRLTNPNIGISFEIPENFPGKVLRKNDDDTYDVEFIFKNNNPHSDVYELKVVKTLSPEFFQQL